MTPNRRTWHRLRRWLEFGRREDDRLHREIDEEIHGHLAARIDHLIARGMSPEAARSEALRRFGNYDAGRARLHADAVERRRRLRLADRFDALRQDVRFVSRTLARSPAFTAGVILTFALGLGINGAIFRVADLVLFRAPAGVSEPHAVRQVETTVEAIGNPVLGTTFSWSEARLVTQSGAFADVSAGTLPRALTDNGRTIAVAYCDDVFLRLLGVRLVAGRLFSAEEGEPGAQRNVAIVAHGYWQRELGGRRLDEALDVTIGTRTYRVIGVTSPGFTGIDLDPTDVWLPLGVAELGRGFVNGVVIPWYQTDMARPLRVIGRLRSGTTDEPAAGRLAAIVSAADADRGRPERSVKLRPIVPVGRAAASESSNRVILRLAGVAGLVLLIAAANATNLLLARGIRRQPELAIRAAIGASRARLCGLLLVESLMLSLAGGATAVVAGGWTAEALRNLLFPDARWTTAAFDVRSLFFVGALAVVSGLVAGLAPALQATGLNVIGSLKDGRTTVGGRRGRTRSGLLVAQAAFALVLLVASGLLVMSLLRLSQQRLGFDVEGLVIASISSTSPANAFRGPDPAAFVAVTRAIASGPSTPAIALATTAPFGAVSRTSFEVPGTSFTAPPADQPSVNTVSANYFAVMGTRVIRGRGFTDEDAKVDAPVSLVNASMARAYWGDTIPPGACILIRGRACAMVIGVVEDLRESPAASTSMQFYFPLHPDGRAGTLIVRTGPDDARSVVERIRTSTPTGYRATVEITGDRVGRALRPWRTAAWLFVTMGLVALALACGGIYSVMTYVATERRHEIGVRMALGATRRDVLRLIVGQGMRLVAIAGVIGLAVAAGGARVLGSLLFDVSPFEPLVYLASLAGIAAAAAVATLVPARRATRVDAVVALRM